MRGVRTAKKKDNKEKGGLTMFGLFKKKEAVELKPLNVAEEMGLREYVSIDSLKAHLVDMMEENRQLKTEMEEVKDRQRKEITEQRKQQELSLVTADEYKKRAREKEEEIRQLKTVIDQQDKKIEKLEQNQNHLKTEAELARAAADKAREEAKTQRECRYWLKEKLEHYGNWEKVTKTQLVEILKKAINEENS